MDKGLHGTIKKYLARKNIDSMIKGLRTCHRGGRLVAQTADAALRNSDLWDTDLAHCPKPHTNHLGRMESMGRLILSLLATFTVVCFADSPKPPATPSATVHGKLIQRENQTPAIETADHKLIVLAGDEATEHVLHDKRLARLDIEAKG